MQQPVSHHLIGADEQPGELLNRISRLLIARLRHCRPGELPPPTTMRAVILFADIAGSTAFTEQIAAAAPEGAEQLGRILGSYFANLIEVITRCGGDVIRINGDAIIALWSQERDPQGARLLAAKATVELREQSATWQVNTPHEVRHRLALAEGPVDTAVLSSGAGRSFFLLTGAPLQAIAAISHAVEPGDIVVDAALVPALSNDAELQLLSGGGARLVGLLHQPVVVQVEAEIESAFLPTFRRFVPRIVIDRSSSGHEAWLGEFRMLSVVFIRLSDLSSVGAMMAEQLTAALDVIGTAAAELGVEIFDVIANDKGLVAEIACGLPPFGQENNAACALEVALRIRTGLAALNMTCATGIATGRAFCGDVGTDMRREYVITGPVMNRGARLMEAAGHGILCEATTARAAADHFSFANPESIRLRGIDEALTIFRVFAPKRAAQLLPAAPGLLHGRNDELEQLTCRIDELREGRTGLLIIEGEPGAGKSRIIAELAHAADARGCGVLVTRTHPVEQTTAYYAFRRILPAILLIDSAEQATEDRLRSRLLDVLADSPLSERAALLEDILSLGFTDRGLANQIVGPARIAGVEDIVVALVTRMTSARPLVLLIDDLHWIDELSSHLVLTLSRRVPRLLIVAASRSMDRVTTAHLARILDTGQTRITLARLGHASITGMVQELLGVRSVPRRLTEFVERQSEGLPLHAEQLALSLREMGLIAIDGGHCRIIIEDLSAASVPQSLHSLIVSRIDTLPEVEHFAAKIASAIGRIFDLEALQAVYPFPADVPHLPRAVELLVAAGILTSQFGTAPSPTYSFRHILIQEATYDLLSYEQRRGLHRRIAELLEDRHKSDLRPHYARLAEHWERADVADKAVDYRLHAADQALQRYANYDVLVQVAKVENTATQQRMGLSGSVQAELARLRGEALHALSRFAEAEQQLSRCSELHGIPVPSSKLEQALRAGREIARQVMWRCKAARRIVDSAERDRFRLVAHLHTRLAEHAYFMSNGLAVVHRTLTALNMAERAGAVSETIEGLGALAIGLGTAGQHRLAKFYRDRSTALADQAGGLQDQALSRLFASVYSFQAGDWNAAQHHGLAGGETYQRLGDAFRYQSCSVLRAFTNIMEGHYSDAEALLSGFGLEAESVDNLPVRAWILSGLSVVDMTLGRPPRQVLTRITTADDHGLHRAERLLCDGIIAAAHLQEGDIGRARLAADAALNNLLQSAATLGVAATSVCATAATHVALAVTESNGPLAGPAWQRAYLACRAMRIYARRTQFCQPGALRVSGYLASARGQPARAIALWRRALHLAVELGMPLEQAACHLALACSSVRGRHRHDRLGTELLNTLGAKPWRITTTTDRARSAMEWFFAF